MEHEDHLQNRWKSIFPGEHFPISLDEASRLRDDAIRRVTALQNALSDERSKLDFLGEITAFLISTAIQRLSERSTLPDESDSATGKPSGSKNATGVTNNGELEETNRVDSPTRFDGEEAERRVEVNDKGIDPDVNGRQEKVDWSGRLGSGSRFSRKGGLRRGSPRTSPVVLRRPRSGSDESLDPPSFNRRSLSTGNLPSPSKVFSQGGTSPVKSADSTPQNLHKAESGKIFPVFAFERGHRPRSMNISGSNLRAEMKKMTKKQQSMSGISTASLRDTVEKQDSKVVLVLPDDAVPTSPSEDIFAMEKEEEEGGGNCGLQVGDDQGEAALEPINLKSPKRECVAKLESREMNRRESRFLDSVAGSPDKALVAKLIAEDDESLVDLDEVSMAVFDGQDDDDDDDNDDECDSSESSDEGYSVLPASAIRVPQSPVIVREKKEGSTSPRYGRGIQETDWAKFEEDMESNPHLAEFYQASLAEFRSSEEENEAPSPARLRSPPRGNRGKVLPKSAERRRSRSPRLSDSSSTDPELAMRKLIVSSILDSEKSYVDALKLICQHYQKPLTAVATTSQPLLSSKDCGIVFYKHDELLRTHSRLHDALEVRVANWSPTQSVADCFGTLVDSLPVYKQYIENYPRAIELLQKRKAENHQLAYFVDSAAQMKSARMRIPLDELLRRPAEKLQSYSQVLKDLLKHTPEEHTDHGQLGETSEAVSDLMRSLNQGSAETDRGRPRKGEVVVELTDSGRKFRHLCLFEDVLVCIKQKGGGRQRKYECKWYLPLSELAFHPPPESEVPGPVPAVGDTELEHLQAKVGKLKLAIRQEQAAIEGKSGKTSALRLVSTKLDKLKKKLREHEGVLRLNLPCLPLRLFDVGGKVYTLLFGQEAQRQVWLESISDAKETAKVIEISPYELGTLLQQSRRMLRKSDSIKSVLMEADGDEEFLNGILQIQVHSAKGILSSRQGKPDLFCSVEVDSYGRFDRKAKTRVVRDSLTPSWDQDFEVDVQGAQTLKILCFDKKSVFNDELCGKGKVELLSLGLTSHQRQSIEVNLLPRGTVKVSLCYTSRSQSLQRRPSYSNTGLFAVPIGVVCRRENVRVPPIVTLCCEEIEQRGLAEVGIYRVSGVMSDVRSLKEAFEKGTTEGKKLLVEIDIHAVSGLLKMYFRELPEPVLTDDLYPRLVEGMALADPEAKQRCMASLLHSLPPINLETSLYLFRHIKRIAANEKVNKMSLNNLATVFGPNLLRPGGENEQTAALEAMAYVGILLNFIKLPDEKLLLSTSVEEESRETDQFQAIPEEV